MPHPTPRLFFVKLIRIGLLFFLADGMILTITGTPHNCHDSVYEMTNPECTACLWGRSNGCNLKEVSVCTIHPIIGQMGLSVHSSGIVEDVAWVSISLFLIQICISIYYVLGSVLGVGYSTENQNLPSWSVYAFPPLCSFGPQVTIWDVQWKSDYPVLQ